MYFVAFPTFFTDMPFLNRQETAFLFVGIALLAMTRRQWSLWHRRLALLVCALGVGLSHYSTMYVFCGTLALAWFLEKVFLLIGRLGRRNKATHRRESVNWADTARALTLGVVIAVAGMAFVWGNVVTKTDLGLSTVVKQALPQVFGGKPAAKASSTGYGILSSGAQPTSSQLIKDYRAQSLQTRRLSSPGTFEPLSEVGRAATPAITPPNLPVTAAGRLLTYAHTSASQVNDLVRGVAARAEQIFVLIGLAAIILMRKYRRQVGRDYYFVGAASILMVAAVTVLPGLSVSYGLLRALQQALMFLAPVLAVGSYMVFRPLGRVWAARSSMVLALVFMASTIGLMPQLLGGYPAQLNLNNSGSYYDWYYMHPQEITALRWLGWQPNTLPSGVQADYISDRFEFKAPNAISGSQYITDIFPTLLRTSTWVLIGYSTLHTGTTVAVVNGNLVDYHYPLSVLNNTKNRVFDNGGAVIYK